MNGLETTASDKQISITESTLPQIDIRLAKHAENEKEIPIFKSFSCRFQMNNELLKLIQEKCDTESYHMLHVAEISHILCEQLELSEKETVSITNAALLHDIGKLKIPSEVLFKVEKLTDEEFAIIREHHRYGAELLGYTHEPEICEYCARIALEHHERMDGSGYLGMKGEEIDLGARIVAVADVFDALVSPRCYKKNWSFEDAFRYILENSGNDFDALVVNAFRASKEKLQRIYSIYGNYAM